MAYAISWSRRSALSCDVVGQFGDVFDRGCREVMGLPGNFDVAGEDDLDLDFRNHCRCVLLKSGDEVPEHRHAHSRHGRHFLRSRSKTGIVCNRRECLGQT